LAVSSEANGGDEMKELRPRFKLWLSTKDAEGALGDGKWRLLRSIETEGSLKAASESLHISYRKAWGDLNKAEESLNTALVEKQRGGNTGGQTGLTDQGRKWLKAYAEFRGDIEKAVEKAYEKHIRKLVK
jgi:molybdate transport system regulatory protein